MLFADVFAGRRPASLYIGRVYPGVSDLGAYVLTRPLSFDGALMLDSLTVELNFRNLSGNGNASLPLISTPSSAILDSTLPFLDLPRSVCFDIAEALSLQYDGITGLFEMDEFVLSKLELLQPSLHFVLGMDTESFTTPHPVEVQLPLEALNHLHAPGLAGDDHRWKSYFPIRIAEEDKGIVLGRTLFQEMYVKLCCYTLSS